MIMLNVLTQQRSQFDKGQEISSDMRGAGHVNAPRKVGTKNLTWECLSHCKKTSVKLVKKGGGTEGDGNGRVPKPPLVTTAM